MTDDKLAKKTTSALVLPEFITQGDRRGADTIGSDDLQMPRLALAQGLSPELDPSSPKYIEDLKVGDAFNSLTGEVYGKDPIEVVIVRVDKPRYIEFDEDNRGAIIDFNVPANDPRTQFTTNTKGDTVKPIATQFREYVALILPSKEPIALSFKGAGLKVAKTLNGLIRLANLPAFALRYVLTPAIMKDAKSGGTYSVFAVKYSAKTEGQARPFVDQETFELAGNLYESIKDRALVPESREEDDEPLAKDTPF